jgi:hypothetical protein
MPDIEFDREEEFDTREHRAYRDDGWMGGPYTEVRYFLSCLTRINYMRTPMEVWHPAAKQFISTQTPQSAWIVQSSYFHEFAVLILKDLYRKSELGRSHPIRVEKRTERAARFVICSSGSYHR